MIFMRGLFSIISGKVKHYRNGRAVPAGRAGHFRALVQANPADVTGMGKCRPRSAGDETGTEG